MHREDHNGKVICQRMQKRTCADGRNNTGAMASASCAMLGDLEVPAVALPLNLVSEATASKNARRESSASIPARTPEHPIL